MRLPRTRPRSLTRISSCTKRSTSGRPESGARGFSGFSIKTGRINPAVPRGTREPAVIEIGSEADDGSTGALAHGEATSLFPPAVGLSGPGPETAPRRERPSPEDGLRRSTDDPRAEIVAGRVGGAVGAAVGRAVGISGIGVAMMAVSAGAAAGVGTAAAATGGATVGLADPA